MDKPTRDTLDILRSISEHLSSRSYCKNLEYEVSMRNTDTGPEIIMHPYIGVYPDIHRRKVADEESVAVHVKRRHFNDVTEIIPGTYLFKLSVNGKRRKWSRSESL